MSDYTLTSETLTFLVRGPEDVFEVEANKDALAVAVEEAEKVLQRMLPMFDVRAEYA